MSWFEQVISSRYNIMQFHRPAKLKLERYEIERSFSMDRLASMVFLLKGDEHDGRVSTL